MRRASGPLVDDFVTPRCLSDEKTKSHEEAAIDACRQNTSFTASIAT
jgi:hypothetical protein